MFDLKNIFIFVFVFFTFFIEGAIASEVASDCLQNLEKEVRCELIKLNIPPKPWVRPVTIAECPCLDVAIIGGGMAGQTAAFALIKEGIVNIKIFDENSYGKEGPWAKYARMNTLRSGKALTGPALDVPGLTCRTWFEASYGTAAWKALGTLPTTLWNDYLHWYGCVLKIPVQNNSMLKTIAPKEGGFELTFDDGEHVVYARKVVLATGREGFGGPAIPLFLQAVPKKFYVHTNEEIDAENMKGKRIVVIGAGASAFDAVAFALENGACRVDMLIRRKEIPSINKFSQLYFPGFLHGFYFLPDNLRAHFFAGAFACGTPPSIDALNRVKGYENLFLHLDAQISTIEVSKDEVVLHTAREVVSADLVIAATGFAVDGWRRLELQSHMSSIKIWDDHLLPEDQEKAPILTGFPYLGDHFQFLEKEPGAAPYLKSIYCFNYGALLSHGLISSDIPGISFGAARLAKGIACDFFLEDVEYYKKNVEKYVTPMFSPEDLP